MVCRSCPQRLKPLLRYAVIAAVTRCATQNRNQMQEPIGTLPWNPTLAQKRARMGHAPSEIGATKGRAFQPHGAAEPLPFKTLPSGPIVNYNAGHSPDIAQALHNVDLGGVIGGNDGAEQSHHARNHKSQ